MKVGLLVVLIITLLRIPPDYTSPQNFRQGVIGLSFARIGLLVVLIISEGPAYGMMLKAGWKVDTLGVGRPTLAGFGATLRTTRDKS
jgi:hypothetical protein